jgi:hypothetical protein
MPLLGAGYGLTTPLLSMAEFAAFIKVATFSAFIPTV